MADVARKHHFIPEFFLANFTPSGTKDDFLCVTDMKERKGYSTKPRNAGFQKDFYRMDVDGAPPDIFERIFGQLEGCAAPAVRHVLEQRALPPHPGFDHLMELIGLLMVRVPATWERVRRAVDQTMKAAFRPYFSDPEAVRGLIEKMRLEGAPLPEGVDYDEVDHEGLVSFVQNEDLYTLSVDKEWLLGQMIEASAHAQTMLFERNWTILVAEGDAGEFICSDAPVCLTWSDPNRQDRVPRLFEHHTEVTVPLGKGVALRGRYESGQPDVVRCDRRASAQLNTRTISSGDRFVYSSGKDFPWERNDGSIGNWDDLISDVEALPRERRR